MRLTPAQERIADKVLSGKAREDFRSFTGVLSVSLLPYDPTNPDEHAMSASLTDRLTSELRPPPEHVDKPLHWLCSAFSSQPDIACWVDGGWAFTNGSWLSAKEAVTNTIYIYLGPAEWDPITDNGRPLTKAEAQALMDDAARTMIEGAQLTAQCAARIAELEAVSDQFEAIGVALSRELTEAHMRIAELEAENKFLNSAAYPAGQAVIVAAQLRRINELEAENSRLNGMLAGKVRVGVADATAVLVAGLSLTLGVPMKDSVATEPATHATPLPLRAMR